MFNQTPLIQHMTVLNYGMCYIVPTLRGALYAEEPKLELELLLEVWACSISFFSLCKLSDFL